MCIRDSVGDAVLFAADDTDLDLKDDVRGLGEGQQGLGCLLYTSRCVEETG